MHDNKPLAQSGILYLPSNWLSLNIFNEITRDLFFFASSESALVARSLAKPKLDG